MLLRLQLNAAQPFDLGTPSYNSNIIIRQVFSWFFFGGVDYLEVRCASCIIFAKFQLDFEIEFIL
jgi:hypothetical protein